MILEDIKSFFDIEKNPKIIKKLPEMFYLAELENRKQNKLSPDIGNTRERILISIFEELFGKENVNDDLGPVEKEVDVEILKERYSIKTLTSKKPKGVKAVWTVDEGSVKKFVKKYKPTCLIIYVHINWGEKGGIYLFDLNAQKKTIKKLGRDKNYFKIPKLDTNPRGVEFSKEAIDELIKLCNLKIEIDWNKPDINFDPKQRWKEIWNSD